ncbi:MAG: Mfa1 fimbrilin C-terminal domain-containing protein, partial [Muribaculaceae bacterium]|nr:Mfa1 fimbrilin C-terminal domain-containing protein [Muribaculaceae bacterium]
DVKGAGDGINGNYTDYFKYPFFGNDNKVQIGVGETGDNWAISYVKDICQGEPNDKYGTESSYYFWRYVTENTIPAPGGNYNLQNNGQTTGVVFKAKMKGTTYLRDSEDPWDQKLYTALTTKTGSDSFKADILYAYAGKKLYCTWEHVQNAALEAAGFNPLDSENSIANLDRSASLYIACFGSGDAGFGTVNYTYRKNGTIVTETFTDTKAPNEDSANTAWLNWKNAGYPATGNLLSQFRQKVTGATFTIYQGAEDREIGWGYYCYYYYWNHHNDNLNNTVLGPMEIAVVRNNVYKLAVTRLNILGHPRIPENDPDSPTPDTPDEKGDIYMQVSVRVVPWVVRFNQIEF